MSVRKPTVGELERIACSYGLDLSHAELESFRALLDGPLASYARIDQLEQPAVPVDHPRPPGYRPSDEDNSLNAWYWRCSIRGRQHGPLPGRTVAVKDNVASPGVPMMNGTSLLEGFVPDDRRDDRHSDPRRRRRDHRQVRLRAPLLLRRESHGRYRSDSQSARPHADDRGLVEREWRPRRGRDATWRSAATKAARSACRLVLRCLRA